MARRKSEIHRGKRKKSEKRCDAIDRFTPAEVNRESKERHLSAWLRCRPGDHLDIYNPLLRLFEKQANSVKEKTSASL